MKRAFISVSFTQESLILLVYKSLSEQKDLYVNFIVQTLQNQFLDCGSPFRLVLEN